MSYTDKLRQQTLVSIETLKKTAGIAQHRTSGATAMSGISEYSIDSVNAAEEALFVAALASLVPGIDHQLHKMRQDLDHAFKNAYGGRLDNTAHSVEVLRRVTYAFEKYGLNTSQLQVA